MCHLKRLLRQFRMDLDVKFLSSYIDRLDQSGFDDAKSIYTRGAHFQPTVAVNIPGGLSLPLKRGVSLYGIAKSATQLRLTVFIAAKINATELILQYRGDGVCALGGLRAEDQIESGCKPNHTCSKCHCLPLANSPPIQV
jgi:hypothetical protein